MQGYAWGINKTGKADLRMATEFGLDWFQDQFHQRPTAVFMHPDTIRQFIAVHGDWPATWPQLIENDKMNRNLMVMELGATTADDPAQMRLL